MTKVLYFALEDVKNINIVKSGGVIYDSYNIKDDGDVISSDIKNTYFYATVTDEQYKDLLSSFENFKFSTGGRELDCRKVANLDLEFKLHKISTVVGKFVSHTFPSRVRSPTPSDVAGRIKYQQRAIKAGDYFPPYVLSYFDKSEGSLTTKDLYGKSMPFGYFINYNHNRDELTIGAHFQKVSEVDIGDIEAIENDRKDDVLNILEDIDDPYFSTSDIDLAMIRLLELLMEKSGE